MPKMDKMLTFVYVKNLMSPTLGSDSGHRRDDVATDDKGES